LFYGAVLSLLKKSIHIRNSPLTSSFSTKIQGVGKIPADFLFRDMIQTPRGMPDAEKPGNPPAFGFIGINRKDLVTPAARMGDMIGASADGPFAPYIDNVKDQWRMDANGRMQTGRWLPCPVSDPGNELSSGSGGMHGQGLAVAEDHVSGIGHVSDPHLHFFQG
jgi:hypothetical protein